MYTFQDIFLLCFAVDNHVSYGNVRDTWIQEIRHHCPKTPVILVGTKVSQGSGAQARDALCTLTDAMSDLCKMFLFAPPHF